jgi:hypothetical protein
MRSASALTERERREEKRREEKRREIQKETGGKHRSI